MKHFVGAPIIPIVGLILIKILSSTCIQHVIHAENQTLQSSFNGDHLNIPEILEKCNDSFRIPSEHIQFFNETGKLEDESDKTPMCFIRCYFERMGFLKEGKLNGTKVKQIWWPATGNTIEVCEKEGDNIENPCSRAYNIASCLTLRSLVDARIEESV